MAIGSDANNVWCMTPSRTFCMVGMNGTPSDCCNCIFDKACLVDGIGMDRYLYIILIGNLETGIDRSRSRTPVLMQLETTSS